MLIVGHLSFLIVIVSRVLYFCSDDRWAQCFSFQRVSKGRMLKREHYVVDHVKCANAFCFDCVILQFVKNILDYILVPELVK